MDRLRHVSQQSSTPTGGGRCSSFLAGERRRCRRPRLLAIDQEPAGTHVAGGANVAGLRDRPAPRHPAPPTAEWQLDFITKFNVGRRPASTSRHRLGGTDNETADGVQISTSAIVVVGGEPIGQLPGRRRATLRPTRSSIVHRCSKARRQAQPHRLGVLVLDLLALPGRRRGRLHLLNRSADQPEPESGHRGSRPRAGRLRRHIDQRRCDVRQRVARRQAGPDKFSSSTRRFLGEPARRWARSQANGSVWLASSSAHLTRSSPPTPGPRG